MEDGLWRCPPPQFMAGFLVLLRKRKRPVNPALENPQQGDP